MQRCGIKVLCAQEIRRPKSDTFASETGCAVALSGGAGGAEGEERAGVRCIIDPTFKQSTVGFVSSLLKCPR
eukprot:2230622-Pyramimonas_sp.AAC.1